MREVLFYRSPSGTSPVEEFLDELGPNKARKVTWVLSLIEELEFVPREYLKKLPGTEDIWEVRIKVGGDSIRFLGFWHDQRFIVLVHAFKKKTKKIRKTDIRLAEARRKEYISR